MRASRLLSLLLLLQTRGRMTAPELAEELEVSVRTVYRDIDSLSAAGVPVYADRGPAGGYQLLDGYRTRLTGLTGDEAESLFLTGMPGQAAAELGLGSVLAATELKLMAALPPELRSRAGRIRERFHLDAPSWFREMERPEHLAAVADAVWNQRMIRIRYERWGQTVVTRTLEPYGLVLKTGVWYVAARATRPEGSGRPDEGSGRPDEGSGRPDEGSGRPDEGSARPDEGSARPDEESRPDGDVRTYRIARIRTLTPLDARFDRALDFDLAAYWQDWSERYRERLYRAEAVVRLSPFAQDLIPYYLGPVAARAARETAGPPDEAGWVRAVIPVESIRHAKLAFFRFGPEVEVLEPTELRDLMRETAEAVHRMYAADGPDAE
ncbi:WYL domain-containing protein [Actinopolymorpha alba]|uniref:HTH domain-containing protein n=1 Tax=Actinopolymorpha alba TaxID=533267 RepID=UPI000377E26C|nr:WYL domain-containing protein [Actinopolymorpha alba]